MTYRDFLLEFAKSHNIATVDSLLSDHAEKYSFQIKSRERARKIVELLTESVKIDLGGKKILDVGCAYGSFSIELAKLGAKVVGIDISDKWLSLAEANARNEVDVPFINCDASTYRAREELKKFAPFDVVIVNDVFEHIYDTAGLLENLSQLTGDEVIVYFKIPNGLATRSVLQEGHKKVFGISLLAPDYWSYFVNTPFHIYYRRWSYYQSLFQHFGFGETEVHNTNRDPDREMTCRHIRNDLARIRRSLKRENYKTSEPYLFLRRAYQDYVEEVESDIATASWDELYFKYRVTFWEGILRKSKPRRTDDKTVLRKAGAH